MGELATQTRGERLLGQAAGTRLDDRPATLAYRSQPDIAALQALTDRGWADLQARLTTAGAEPASQPGALVLLEGESGETTQCCLTMAPTGRTLMQRSAAGRGPGNLSAKLAYPTHDVEGLSLAMASNFSALVAGGQWLSGYSDANSVSPPSRGATLSPLIELAPTPATALVHAPCSWPWPA